MYVSVYFIFPVYDGPVNGSISLIIRQISQMKIKNAALKEIEKVLWDSIFPVYTDCSTYFILFHNLNKFFIIQGFHHKKRRACFGREHFKIRMFNIVFLISFLGNDRFANKSFGNQVFYTII